LLFNFICPLPEISRKAYNHKPFLKSSNNIFPGTKSQIAENILTKWRISLF